MFKDFINNNVRKSKYLAKKTQKMLLEPVIGYTRVVFATKYILSFIAALLVLILILLPVFNPVHDNFRITFTSPKGEKHTATDEEAKMLNPRFQGIDKDDQTYNITADNAIKKDDDTLILNNMNADITLKDYSWVALIANTGIFDYKGRSLKLDKSVNLFTNDGYEFYAKSLNIDISDNSAYSDTKVHGHGPMGSITADSVRVFDKGDRVLFKGNVHVTLTPKSKSFFATEDE